MDLVNVERVCDSGDVSWLVAVTWWGEEEGEGVAAEGYLFSLGQLSSP